MRYDVELAEGAVDDLVDIHEFLVESYTAFGDEIEEALARANVRIEKIKRALRDLGAAPRQGTQRPEIRPGLRNVTKDRAVVYFDVDDERRRLRVLAVFYGGQDHHRKMLQRALS